MAGYYIKKEVIFHSKLYNMNKSSCEFKKSVLCDCPAHPACQRRARQSGNTAGRAGSAQEVMGKAAGAIG